MTRRGFIAGFVPILGSSMPTLGEAARAGVHLTGRLDATETERVEQTVNFGKACAIFVNDPAMWAAVQPLIGSEVQFSMWTR